MAARRKKKTDEPQPFSVGAGTEEKSEEERPPLSEETVDGILDLRGHFDQRVPTGMLWPFRELPSMQQHMSDLESAGEAVDKLAVRHGMSNAKLGELRRFLIEDAYAMTYLVCRHRDIVPEVHMAMCYASAGHARKLAWLITQSGFEGYVIERFRESCAAHGIDPRTTEGVNALALKLTWQDQRWPRGWYKSSSITHGGTVIEATADPNRTILIVCAKEDKAFELVGQCGQTITSGIYRDIFPDRVPPNARDIQKSEIAMPGRTVSSRERTIQGASYISREIGGHYSTIRTDDLIVRDVRGGIVGGGEGGPAIRWLHGMRGMRIMSQPFRRIHVGTINDSDNDDHAWLVAGRRAKRVVSIVVPAEYFPDGKFPDSVYERGTPTAPTFFNQAAIIEALDDVLADETEPDGVEAFRSDFWLAPVSKRSRLFLKDDADDPGRTWRGPYEHPKAKLPNQKINYAAHFMIGKVPRDEQGNVVAEPVKALDPFEDMDMVLTLSPTWREGGRLWAISAVAVDPQMVKFHLETRSGDEGMEQWIPALESMFKQYNPRAIGMTRQAYVDPLVQNALKTDKRLIPLARRVVSVDSPDGSEEARIRAGVAEPLKSFRLLLAPKTEDDKNDFGASLVRREMVRYRVGSENPWPVLESLAMVDSIAIRVPTREERDRAIARIKDAVARHRASVNPAFGVPA